MVTLNNLNTSIAINNRKEHCYLRNNSAANSLSGMAKRRDLTDEEKEWAANLARLWELKQESDGLSQLAAAQELGYKTQSAFWQFLVGRVPLHTDAKAKMARFLDVDVTEIDPAFYKRLGLSPSHLPPAVAQIAELLTHLDKDDIDEILALTQAKFKRRTKSPPPKIEGGGREKISRQKT
jgi:hypothetical protein